MKKALRQELRQRLASITPQKLHERSVAACNRLIELPDYEKCETLMIYLSMPQEVDTTTLALRAWGDGKRVLAPKVSWEQRRMLPIEIRSLNDDVRSDAMGLREPIDGLPIPVSEIDFVIVPGLGFDELGNRLGRGRGFYDRFLLHRDFRAVACGLAFEDQVVAEVPHDDSDAKMGLLVTDAKLRRFRK